MPMRVLLISYFFPPDGGPGTQRSAKFCKYIWRHGWTPTVLTRSTPATRGRWDPEDCSMLRDVPAGTQVVRMDGPETPQGWASKLTPIDTPRTLAWAEAAYERAVQIIDANMIDLVFISMSPFDLSHLGRRLQSQTRIPVVYDLRDPWALDGWRMHRSRARWRRDMESMAATLAQATGVIANTPAAREAMLEAVPGLDEERICTIPNGYDEHDFLRRPGGDFRRDPESFSLVHTGSLHSKRVETYRGPAGMIRRRLHFTPEPIDPVGRTLGPLLGAINQLKKQQHPLTKVLKLVLAGAPDDASKRTVKRARLEGLVQWQGYMPHHESVALLQQADALLLPLHGLPPGRRSLIVPGKTYEYLASGRPILACLPEGDARDMLATSPYAFCADPCDETDIAGQLMKMHEKWEAGELDHPQLSSWITRFDRRQLTAGLAEFFDRIAGTVGIRDEMKRAA